MSLQVLGIAGSLRRGSYNRALLRAAAAVAPDGLRLEIAEIGSIPLFDADLEASGTPEPVQTFRRRIVEADALLIATPEYNRSIPGVLKNAIDWASRPPNQPLAGKPLGIFGASDGQWGTVRAQVHLRAICSALGMLVLARPELMVSHAHQKFDAAGELTDEPTRELLRKYLVALRDWTLRLQRGLEASP